MIVRRTEIALQAMATEQQESFDKRADLHQLASYEPKTHTLLSGVKTNDFDCGVFSLATLDWLTDGITPYPPTSGSSGGGGDYVNQSDMPNLRRRFALELLKGQLLRTTLSPTRQPAPEGEPEETHAPKVVKYIPQEKQAPVLKPSHSLWQLVVRFEKQNTQECDALEMTDEDCNSVNLPLTSAGTYCYVCALQLDTDGSVFADPNHKHKHFENGKKCKNSKRNRGWCKLRASQPKPTIVRW